VCLVSHSARGGWASDRLAFLFDSDDGHPGEDCLRLNVWTPAADDRSKRPVMVWLRGGGHEAGSSRELPLYDGGSLSRRGDVVVVSVNHRLNVFALHAATISYDRQQWHGHGFQTRRVRQSNTVEGMETL